MDMHIARGAGVGLWTRPRGLEGAPLNGQEVQIHNNKKLKSYIGDRVRGPLSDPRAPLSSGAPSLAKGPPVLGQGGPVGGGARVDLIMNM